MNPVFALAIVVAILGAYAFGEWVGKERERIRHQRSAEILDFTRLGKRR